MTRTFLLFDAAASPHAFHLLQFWLDEEIEAEEDTDEEDENAERDCGRTPSTSPSPAMPLRTFFFIHVFDPNCFSPLQITYCKFDHTEL